MINARPIVSAAFVFAAVVSFACGKEAPTPPPPDPKRCEIVDLGEASDVVESGNIPDDAMVRVSGIGHPGSLVWQDKHTKQAYFLTRIMGSARRLFYMQELETGETPKVLSVFEGHIQRWDHLPKEKAIPIAGALMKDYKIEIDPTQAYLITAGSKPAGCP